MQSTPPTSRCDASPPSDLELVDVTACGDHRGYELLTKKYQNRLFKSILQRVGCAVAAEEIVQDAFVRAFLNLRSFRRDSNFYTWLYRIALNSSRSELSTTPENATVGFPRFRIPIDSRRAARRFTVCNRLSERKRDGK